MTSRYLVSGSPGVEEAAVILREAISSKKLVVMGGLCEAKYEGRGASEAEAGDKIVIVKSDGSVIVHGLKGFKPLNWQPDTSYIGVEVEGGYIKLSFLRRKPRELLVVKCGEVGFIAVVESPVEGGYWMFMTEDEIRDAIAADPEGTTGESIVFPEKERRLGEAGYADLYGYDSSGRPVIIEVKRVKAGEDAVKQLIKYVEKARSMGKANVRGILVAPDITEAARALLERSGLEFKRIDLKKLYSAFKASRRRTLEDFIGTNSR